MGMWDNAFEKRWTLIFAAMYVIVMLPVKCFFATEYAASWMGLPLFMVGWFWHTLVTMILIVVFYFQAMRRDEYREFSAEN
jgi:uncharacterized membrane protein